MRVRAFLVTMVVAAGLVVVGTPAEAPHAPTAPASAGRATTTARTIHGACRSRTRRSIGVPFTGTSTLDVAAPRRVPRPAAGTIS